MTYVDDVHVFAGEFDAVLSDKDSVLELAQRAEITGCVLPRS